MYISEDLALATLKKREPLVPKLKAAKQAGKTAYFILDWLVIRDKRPLGAGARVGGWANQAK